MPLTKQQARETIEAGGSVLYKGKLLTKVEHLKHFDGTQEEKQSEIESLRARLAELEPAETAAGGDAGKPSESEKGGLDDSADELMKHTRAQLVEKAAEAGVEIGETDTKQQIVDAILAK